MIALTRMCRSDAIKGQANASGVVKEMLSEVEIRSRELADTGALPKASSTPNSALHPTLMVVGPNNVNQNLPWL